MDGVLSFGEEQVNLEVINLSEIGQAEKEKCYMIVFICRL
jgi:hypothetical protein